MHEIKLLYASIIDYRPLFIILIYHDVISYNHIRVGLRLTHTMFNYKSILFPGENHNYFRVFSGKFPGKTMISEFLGKILGENP